MRKGKKIGVVFLTAVTLFFTACGSSIPEMTEEENAQVVEYAAGLLLKYDENHHSRLVEEPEKTEEEIAAENEASVGRQIPEQKREIAVEEQAASEQQAPEVINVSSEAAVEENRSIVEFYGIEGAEITYAGHELKDLYPDNDTEEVYFAIHAAPGFKLLILNFDVKNIGGQDINLDMIAKNAKFKISINGDTPKYALTTMLMDDLASYIGTVPAGASQRLVLVCEIPEGKTGAIDTIDLQMKTDSDSAVISLE